MTYVICEPCIGVNDNSCVEVYPVDRIHPTPEELAYEQADMLVIELNAAVYQDQPADSQGPSRP